MQCLLELNVQAGIKRPCFVYCITHCKWSRCLQNFIPQSKLISKDNPLYILFENQVFEFDGKTIISGHLLILLLHGISISLNVWIMYKARWADNCDVTSCPVIMRRYANADGDEQQYKTSEPQGFLVFFVKLWSWKNRNWPLIPSALPWLVLLSGTALVLPAGEAASGQHNSYCAG